MTEPLSPEQLAELRKRAYAAREEAVAWPNIVLTLIAEIERLNLRSAERETGSAKAEARDA